MKCERCKFFIQEVKPKNWFVGDLVSYCKKSGDKIECCCGGFKNFCDLKEDDQ